MVSAHTPGMALKLIGLGLSMLVAAVGGGLRLVEPIHLAPASHVASSAPASADLRASTMAASPAATPVDERTWQSYANGRFGYTVRFPGNWRRGPESDNGDGLWITTDNPTARVAVYAGYVVAGVDSAPASSSGTARPIRLDSGREATLTTRQHANVAEEQVDLTVGNVAYHVLVRAPASYVQAHAPVLNAVLRSLSVGAPGGGAAPSGDPPVGNGA